MGNLQSVKFILATNHIIFRHKVQNGNFCFRLGLEGAR